MGQKVRNVEAVTDFADGRHFVRLHRDIALPAEVCDAVRRHLMSNRWEEAMSLTLEHAPADSHAEVELFFRSTAERLAKEPLDVEQNWLTAMPGTALHEDGAAQRA